MFDKSVRAKPAEIAELVSVDVPEGDSAFLASIHVVVGTKAERCAVVVNATRDGEVLILRGVGTDESPRPAYRCWAEANGKYARLLVWSRELPIIASLLAMTPIDPSAPTLRATTH